MRLFTAINLDDRACASLRVHMDHLAALGVEGQFARRENLYLPLVFIGETDRPQAAKAAMAYISGAPFSMTLREMGVLRRSGDILWIGVEAPTALYDMYRQLEYRLAAAGFLVKPRPYKPQVTLGRRILLPEGFDLQAEAAGMPDIMVQVNAISLMESNHADGLATYSEYYRHELRG